MTYLVTGATGGLGGYVLGYLRNLVPSSQIVALARSRSKAADLEKDGIAVRVGDYSDAASLRKAFEGVDRMLFISGAPGNREAEHANVVDAAKAEGVSFIAYTSFANAGNVDNMLSSDHQFTEDLIERSGIAHTFLRNNWYLENEETLLRLALESGELDFSAGDATVGWALKREYAEAAAQVLAGLKASPSILELSGPAHTYRQLAQALSRASGKSIEARDLDGTHFVQAMGAAGIPEAGAKGILGIQELIKAGDLELQSQDFEAVLGHSLTAFDEAVKEVLHL
ncbi:MAG: NAD(P)H-binding protein [Bifidobacterium sp.]|uniref:NAD(P)H-binding protein n=1 Tax=Bifidobacterium fermentum TaxID=3059035 RepID=A0AB39UJH1_9BIFI